MRAPCPIGTFIPLLTENLVLSFAFENTHTTMKKPGRNRPDKDGCHKAAFLRSKKILYATQSYCAICGRPVDFSLKFPDPMSPTADHIVPIAKGGHPSALENLQLTHLGCNQKKGDKLFKQRKEPIRCSNRSLQLSADWRTL